MTFPQLDLPPDVHSRTRAELVRAATRPRMPRFVVPLVAAAAVVAVVAAGVAVTRWAAPPKPRPASDTKGLCGDTRPGTRADARGLTYVLDVPTGWGATASVDLVRYCRNPQPDVTFSSSTEAVRVYRGFSTRIVAKSNELPADVAKRNLSPLGPDQEGANVDLPYKPVDINGQPGRLISRYTVAWPVDDQWWTVQSGTGDIDKLLAHARALTIDHGLYATWPGAKAAGYQTDERFPGPSDNRTDGEWLPQWNVCLRQVPGSSGVCTVAMRAARWDTANAVGPGYGPQQAITDQAHRTKEQSAGEGRMTDDGVFLDSWYLQGKDARAAATTWDLKAVDSEEVTHLLGAPPVTPPAAGPTRDTGRCKETRAGTRADADGLTYAVDIPKGWTANASVDLVRYCAAPQPLAQYDGKDAIVTVYRGFSTRNVPTVSDQPTNEAQQQKELKAWQKLYERPLTANDYGSNVDAPYTPVNVDGHAGRLMSQTTVAWQADGQWWTVVSYQARGEKLVEYASQLKTVGSEVSWPNAKAAGFTPEAIMETPGYHPGGKSDPVVDLPEGSWQPQWNLCLRKDGATTGACTVVLRAARWYNSGGGYQPLKLIYLQYGQGGGASTGRWFPKDVIVTLFSVSEAEQRKVKNWHLVDADSDEVTQLLDAGQAGTAPSSSSPTSTP